MSNPFPGTPPVSVTGDGSSPRAAAEEEPGAAADLRVSGASSEEWQQVVEWAAAEGWNPGHGDAACFHAVDPAGFLLGRLADRTVSAISVVAYSEQYAFLGYYLVHPELRGRGLGLATWRSAFPRAGSRTVGLDAVPAQQETYRRSGFAAAHRTLRCAGRPARSGVSAPGVVPLAPALLAAVAEYDRRCFPAGRRAFLTRWLTVPGRTVRVHLAENRVAGYGMIRPARSGWRIGPLFADTPQIAEGLWDALVEGLGPDDEVVVDIPEPHGEAVDLAVARGLETRSHTVRMYTGPVPDSRQESVYGVTSLELG